MVNKLNFCLYNIIDIMFSKKKVIKKCIFCSKYLHMS